MVILASGGAERVPNIPMMCWGSNIKAMKPKEGWGPSWDLGEGEGC
jgi:hypothetical protein